MSDFLMCPLGGWTECQGKECAWYDEVDYHCAIATIADALANIHGHARDLFAKAHMFDKYVLNESGDAKDEED